MPQVPIIMPQLGESIAEATIVDIKVKPGDEVADDQEILDVETNKAVMGVTTPCKGKIAQITVQLKETYPVGAVLGYVEASEADAARFARQAPPQAQREVAEEIPARADQEVAPAREKKVAARDGDGGRAAAKLDAAAFNDWFVGKSRSRAAGSTVARSQTRPRPLRVARACTRACRNSRRGGEINRQSRCAINFNRRRNCG